MAPGVIPGDVLILNAHSSSRIALSEHFAGGTHMPCKLQPVPDSPDFEAPAGEEVTLVTNDHIGNVMIAKAEYAGAQLVPPGQAVSQVTLRVAAERNSLKLVCVFTASVVGRGELREHAGADSQFLRELRGDEPFHLLRIRGR